ncbi:MAG: DUF4097 family beta strand repeat-containing protein [Acidobacteriaceae bacterium]
MNLRFAAAILALAFTPTALFAAEATFNKTLHVTGPATINVSTDAGYIHITPGPNDSIHIVGHIHASSSLFSGSAEERAEQVAGNPPIKQAGNTIEIGRNTHYSNIGIDYVITAPRGTSVEATSGAGEINVSNLFAPLSAKVDAGNIDANELTGNVALTAGSGNITAMMDGATQIKISTGNGNVDLTNVAGSLYAETANGDVNVQGQPSANWKLALDSGTVTVNVGSQARFSLDALTGHGSIQSTLPIVPRGASDPQHTVGDVNGGGPTIHIQTGSGNVIIE